MTLTEFADEMNRIIPQVLNKSIDVSVEAIGEMYRVALATPLGAMKPATKRPEEAEDELRRLLRDRGLALRGPLDSQGRRLTVVRSSAIPTGGE